MTDNQCTSSNATKPVLTAKPRLRIDSISLTFGGVKALAGVDINVFDHEILAIIGPNGAGKTSVLNCLSGFYKPQRGEIYFDGQLIRKDGEFLPRELKSLNRSAFIKGK